MKTKLLSVIAIIGFFACDDDNTRQIDLSLTSDLDKAGILNFSDSKDFIGYVTKKDGSASGRAMSNFVSFGDVYYKAVAELSEAQDLDRHNELLKEYGDVLMLVDSAYKPRI